MQRIHFVIDKSGSMANMMEDVKEGIRVDASDALTYDGANVTNSFRNVPFLPPQRAASIATPTTMLGHQDVFRAMAPAAPLEEPLSVSDVKKHILTVARAVHVPIHSFLVKDTWDAEENDGKAAARWVVHIEMDVPSATQSVTLAKSALHAALAEDLAPHGGVRVQMQEKQNPLHANLPDLEPPRLRRCQSMIS